MTTKKSKTTTWPKVTTGTHLTVVTYEDGKTVLSWDDEQLLKEVREATSAQSTAAEAKPKRSKKAKL